MKLSFILKLSITALAIGFAISQINFNLLLSNVASLNVQFLCYAFFLMFFQMLLGIYRWQAVIYAMGEFLPFKKICQYFFIGVFFSCYLPGGVGGDVFRIWFVKSDGFSLKKSIGVVLVDRLVGLVALVAYVVILIPIIYINIGNSPLFYLSLFTTSCLSIGIGMLLLIDYLPAFLKKIKLIQKIIHHKNQLLMLIRFNKNHYNLAFCISIICYIIQSVLYYLLAKALNIPLTLMDCILFSAPVTLLVMAFPFSLAGWGLREGTIMMALSSFNVANEKAFLLSVFFGILSTVTSLPGGLIWLVSRREKQSLDFSSMKDSLNIKSENA